MNALLELNLALILFLPWYAVVLWIFWRATGKHAAGARKIASLAFCVLSLVAAGIAGVWALGQADPAAGAIWRQVIACVAGYAAFLSVLTVGAVVVGARGGKAR